MRRIVPVLVMLSGLLAPRAALPCGPGVHVREADRAYEAIAAGDADWSNAGLDPLARSYLRLGAISPDFQWMAASLGFGHEFSLSYHLLDAAAAKGPLFRLFALGHLSHVTSSDPACEMFIAPTLVASSPIGVLDLSSGDDTPRGEAEGILEAFGDFVLGDYDAIVDTLYDLWLDGDEAKARGHEVFDWYCSESSKFLKRTTDCAAAWAQFSDTLGYADQFLAGQDRDGAREFVHSVIDQPLPDLAALFTGGIIQQVTGGRMDTSENFDREYQRFLKTAIVTDGFWQSYRDSLGRLGPAWAGARLAARNSGFPSWGPNPLTCGNIESMMQFLPEAYQVVPGLIVDDLKWQTAAGGALSHLSADDQGSGAKLVVRFFSAFPFFGTVKAKIRKDLPGLDPTNDPVVGEGGTSVVIDPLAYVTMPRTTFEVPFTVDATGALGLYAELWLEGGAGPWFTTSWDRLWTIPDVDVDRPAIRFNFGTYDHWPPSLRVDTPDVTDANLFVKVLVAPAGGGVDQAQVVVGEGDRTKVAGWNGVVVFDQAGSQPLDLHVTAPGFAPSKTVPAQPVALRDTWVFVPLHGLPRVAVPGPWQAARDCVSFKVAAAPFQGQVDRFLSKARTIDAPVVTTDVTEATPDKDEKACFAAPLADGARVEVAATPRYLDGTAGLEGVSTAVGIDGSAPTVSLVHIDALEEGGCAEVQPGVRPIEVSVEVTEPHSPLAGYAWRVGSADWVPIEAVSEAPGEIPGTRLATFRPSRDGIGPGVQVGLRATNAAGLSGEAMGTVPETVVNPPCIPETATDLGPGDLGPTDLATPDRGDEADATEPDPGTTDLPAGDVPATDVPGTKHSGGCSTGGPASGPMAWWLLLAVPGLVARRRRP